MIIGIDYRQIVSDMQNVKKRSLAFVDDDHDKQQVNKTCIGSGNQDKKKQPEDVIIK